MCILLRFSFSSIFHKTMSAELGSIFVKFCIICKIFTKMDIFICFDSSYSFQYESILQDFYKYTKGVNIIRIFIFFNFPQNYGCWTLSSFIKFYIYDCLTPLTVFKQVVFFILQEIFYIYQRCAYFIQDFFTSSF